MASVQFSTDSDNQPKINTTCCTCFHNCMTFALLDGWLTMTKRCVAVDPDSSEECQLTQGLASYPGPFSYAIPRPFFIRYTQALFHTLYPGPFSYAIPRPFFIRYTQALFHTLYPGPFSYAIPRPFFIRYTRIAYEKGPGYEANPGSCNIIYSGLLPF